jgi:hypothetical protein
MKSMTEPSESVGCSAERLARIAPVKADGRSRR